MLEKIQLIPSVKGLEGYTIYRYINERTNIEYRVIYRPDKSIVSIVHYLKKNKIIFR